MKKQLSIKLSLPQPCHESWDKMTPAEKGRFCLNCQTTVTDFTKLSDAAIIELLQSKQASICARFLPHQLDRTLSMPANGKRRKPFVSIAAIAAALTIALPFAKAANHPERVRITTNSENKQQIPISPQQDTARFVSGMITDKDGFPLPGTTVRIKNQSVGTATDVTGKFLLRVPDNFKKKVLKLEVSGLGYAKETVRVVLNKNSKPLEIRLKANITVLGRYDIHFDDGGQKRASVLMRFNDKVRTFFS